MNDAGIAGVAALIVPVFVLILFLPIARFIWIKRKERLASNATPTPAHLEAGDASNDLAGSETTNIPTDIQDDRGKNVVMVSIQASVFEKITVMPPAAATHGSNSGHPPQNPLSDKSSNFKFSDTVRKQPYPGRCRTL